MKQIVPDYYAQFHCIAGDCRDNCCRGGWEIELDEETAQFYLAQQGENGQTLREAIRQDTDGYCLRLEHGQCTLLDGQGLCRVYQMFGPEKMGVVCTQFPRFSEYFGEKKETGIGLACEEAARIILSREQPVQLTESLSAEEPYEDSEYEQDFAERIFRMRRLCFSIVKGGAHPSDPAESLMQLLLIGNRVQKELNDNALSAVDTLLQQYEQEWKAGTLTRNLFARLKPEGRYGNYGSHNLELLEAFERLEVLKPAWNTKMEQIHHFLGTEPALTGYPKLAEEWKQVLAGQKPGWRAGQNLVEYFLYRYFAKAVYDHDVLGKCKLCAVFFLILQFLDLERWQEKKAQKAEYTFADRMELIHLFSREVEYSEENMEQLQEEFLFDACYKTDFLIYALTNYQFRL